jgi:molybdopterin molybdotransferase
MTGAPIPKGADSVLMVEHTARISVKDPDQVHTFSSTMPGENIRKAGQDIKKGEVVLSKGLLLSSAHIGLIASLGKAEVQIIRKPRVAILATGNELKGINQKLMPGMIHNSNSYSLYSQALRSGASAVNLGIAKDNMASLEKKIKVGLKQDVLIISGGVSVGEYDLVKDALIKFGVQLKFWKVAIRPGKPLVYGQIGKTLADHHKQEVLAELTEDISKSKGLRFFLRAQTFWDKEGFRTKTTGPQGSGILKSMALANSLIILPEALENVPKGQKVQVQFLD